MKLLCNDLEEIYVWVDDHDESIEISPHFDYEEDAIMWKESIEKELKKIKTREDIIRDMCYTWRHDYGLDKQTGGDFDTAIPSGMTDREREHLHSAMSQLFDTAIAPYMKFKEQK